LWGFGRFMVMMTRPPNLRFTTDDLLFGIDDPLLV